MHTSEIEIGEQTSLAHASKTVWTTVSKNRFAIVRVVDSSVVSDDTLVKKLFSIMTEIGKEVASSVSLAVLESDGSEVDLATHTEGIYRPDGIIPFFALGCVRPSQTGGVTRIIDAERAANHLRRRFPEICGVHMRYESLAHPEMSSTHALVEQGVLRYRAKVHTNTMLDTSNAQERRIYRIVDTVVSQSIILEHRWNRGQMIFVDNTKTLHNRSAFSGKRVIIRARYSNHGDCI